MINYKIDATALRGLGRYYDGISLAGKKSAVRAANEMGQEIVANTAAAIAAKYAQDPDEIRRRILVSEATPEHPEWEMDASLVVASNTNWDRPWTTRGDDAFSQDTLINIVTSEDEAVCPICQQFADENPHMLQEVLDIAAKWADYVPPTPNISPGVITNLIHPRCRCTATPWSSYRRTTADSVFQGGSNTTGPAFTPTRLVDAKQFGRIFNREMRDQLRMITRTK